MVTESKNPAKINNVLSYTLITVTLFILSVFCLNGFPLRIVVPLAVLSVGAGYLIWWLFHRKNLEPYLVYLAFLASPAVILILIETINGSFFELGRVSRILNYLIILAFFMILRAFIPRFFISVLVGDLALFAWSCINCFVERFRGKPILPYDLAAASTAIEVAGEYDFTPTLRMIAALIAIILWTVLLFKLESSSRKIRQRILMPALLCGACIVGIAAFGNDRFEILRTNPWDEAEIATIYRQQGMVLSFIKYATVMTVEEPEGYSAEELRQWAENYQRTLPEPEDISSAPQPQTIIMVMNESLADMSVLGRELPETYMPFLESIPESSNTVKGNLYVSVRGGNTCNTEWESLTGNSTVFLPGGATPFVSYIDHDSCSMASYFKGLGYLTEGIHLYEARGWNRNIVYPYLGFDEFYSIDDFEIDEILRGFATDSENYRKVIEVYEENAGKKQFIYNVTIQNHGGYSEDERGGMDITTDLSAFGDFPEAELYFSLIRLSDEALSELISYFENVDEPVMIIVYGDHQPFLGNDVDDWLSDVTSNTAGSILNKYITPFLIWTNYDADLESFHDIDRISANFLPGLILKAGNFPLPLYEQYLWDIFDEYPVITTAGILDRDGNYYKSVSSVDDPDGMLKRYEEIEYNNMFDTEDPVDILYELPNEEKPDSPVREDPAA